MNSDKITVYVNGKPKRLFRGLRVRHAIGARKTRAVQAHRAVVRDADGNIVDVDGSLYEGSAFYVSPISPEAYADEVQRLS